MNDLINQIIHGDCLEVMKDIPDKSIDLVLTDPPYDLDTTSPAYNSKIMSLGKYHDKNYKDLCNGFDYDGVFSEFKRILKKVNIFTFCSNKQILKILNYWDGYIVNILVWHKFNAPPFANGVWANDIEYVIHIREKGATFQGKSKLKRKVKKYPIVRGQHPTEKPVKLLVEYLKIGSNENDIILDCFAGSGTTAIACYETGRKYICIEKEKKYVDIARKRLSDKQNCYSLLENIA